MRRCRKDVFDNVKWSFGTNVQWHIKSHSKHYIEHYKVTEIMGGALVILFGDFRQMLPVIPKSTPADEINACLKQSFLQPQVKTVQ
ncbi:hypothetical protein J437_LFUL011631 [Ladona fulva]|uniref:ATP-dependent DNA helicase n=1 Tax=Ladona fulva TaxID=123851 RepID=A0A8K0NWV7_LADFU|nr:hypothetical protein J437_LFUL011631 [Ladona fulva]